MFFAYIFRAQIIAAILLFINLFVPTNQTPNTEEVKININENIPTKSESIFSTENEKQETPIDTKEKTEIKIQETSISNINQFRRRSSNLQTTPETIQENTGGDAGGDEEEPSPILPTITFNPITKTYGDTSFTPSISSNSSGSLSFSIDNASIATVSGNTISIVGIGTTTIRLTQAVAEGYLEKTATTSLVVNAMPATHGSFDDITKQRGDNPFTLTAPTSNSPGSFSYLSSNASVATISGNTVTLAGQTGEVTITARQDASGYYATTSTHMTLTVNGGYCDNNPEVCNSGTCTNEPNNGFTCTCSGSYAGQFCTECNPYYNTCKNSSTCIPTISGALCQCTETFCGISCSRLPDGELCVGGSLEVAGPPGYGFIFDIKKMADLFKANKNNLLPSFSFIDLFLKMRR